MDGNGDFQPFFYVKVLVHHPTETTMKKMDVYVFRVPGNIKVKNHEVQVGKCWQKTVIGNRGYHMTSTQTMPK